MQCSKCVDKLRLLNDLVGAAEQREWEGDAKHSGGLEVDDQIDFCPPLHRQVRRLFALENAASVDAGQTVVVRNTAE